jgi:hypothetical protein
MGTDLGAVMVPTVRARSLLLPSANPTPQPGATVAPGARKSVHHVAGEVVGTRVRYGDLNAFAWYYAGGYLTLNRGRKRISRTVRGAEDAKRKIQ